MMTKLSFYDQARQTYAGTVPPAEAGEFMIGGYVDDDGAGGLDGRGEFAIVLYRFEHVNVHDFDGPNIPAPTMTPQLRVFDDAYGALREATDAGLLDALARATIRTPDDLTRILLGLGFRDRSHNPIAKVT